jgi:hypothetical protein
MMSGLAFLLFKLVVFEEVLEIKQRVYRKFIGKRNEEENE